MIDVLKRIEELKNLHGWSEYNLAEKSTLAQSTISSWYRQNMLPSISSLEKICNAFDISLSEFFAEDNDAIYPTDQQRELLKAFSLLSPNQKDLLIKFLKEK